MCFPGGVLSPGGCTWFQGVSGPGGMYLVLGGLLWGSGPGGCLLWGGVVPVGVSTLGGGVSAPEVIAGNKNITDSKVLKYNT